MTTSSRSMWVLPHLPAAMLLLLSSWAGTFQAPLGPHGVLASYSLILLVALYGAAAVGDPLRLGRGFALLPWLLVALLAYLAWYGPQGRAGRVAVILLPAWLLLPAAVARCWPSERARRDGLVSIALVVAGVAGWSLYGWLWLGTSEPALPLGHHNLLATWLVVLMPFAWKLGGENGGHGWLGRCAAVLALVALVSTRSLAGLGGLLAQLGWWLWHTRSTKRRARRWAVLAVIGILLVLALPRLSGIAGSSDLSATARIAYAEAGWDGFKRQPWFGWGAGSVPWTIGLSIDPRPGVLPAGQVIADLHSLPLQLLYELGVVGCLLLILIGWRYLRCRRREKALSAASDAVTSNVVASNAVNTTTANATTANTLTANTLTANTLTANTTAANTTASWLGLAVCSLGGLPLTVTALPFCAVLIAGMELSRAPWKRRDQLALSVWIFVPVAFFLLWPLGRAQLEYQQALKSTTFEEQRAHLWLAAHLDKDFPLYRSRLAWLDGADPWAADRALAAAEEVTGLAGAWIQAGILGRDHQRVWTRGALEQACRLDPHGPMAPLVLAFAFPRESTTREDLAAQWAARALLADPSLLAAKAWQKRPWLLRRALDLFDEHPGLNEPFLDGPWRREFLQLAANPPPESGEVRLLALRMDQHPSTSFSLFAYRRTPWPIELIEIEVDAGHFGAIPLDSAVATGSIAAEVLDHPSCALVDPTANESGS